VAFGVGVVILGDVAASEGATVGSVATGSDVGVLGATASGAGPLWGVWPAGERLASATTATVSTTSAITEPMTILFARSSSLGVRVG